MSTVVNRIDLPTFTGGVPEKTPILGERIDLIGHVKVRLVIALGGAEISVSKLFSLAVNDVIELDRDVDAPVDIRLNDKLIARGMLVAVGDRFGVRVTEIQPD